MTRGISLAAAFAWGAPYAVSFPAVTLACVTTGSVAGCSLSGAEEASRFAATESTGRGASFTLSAKVALLCAKIATAVRVAPKNRAAARHCILDSTRFDWVSSCNGVAECSCTLSFINRCIHKRTLIERPARCQDRPFCRVLHCRLVRPGGRTKLTR